jgi:NADH-quinone oxidoreductase subunit G
MEGLNRDQPSSLLPFVWSPGWNSNQSLHKFQSEVGGCIKGGSAGIKLFNHGSAIQSSNEVSDIGNTSLPAAFSPVSGKWLLVPRHRIYGSEELSIHSPAIAELLEPAFIEISAVDAEALNVLEADNLNIYDCDGHQLSVLPVRINEAMATGCVGYSIGLKGAADLPMSEFVTLFKVEGVGDV